MNDRQKEQWVHLVTWASLPRTMAMLFGSGVFALMSTTIDNSQQATEITNLGIASCLFVWFGVYILCKIIHPATILHNIIWRLFGWLIIFISLQPVKTAAYIILVGIALWNGASIVLTILYFGVLWLIDYSVLTSFSKQLPKE